MTKNNRNKEFKEKALVRPITSFKPGRKSNKHGQSTDKPKSKPKK